MCRSAALFLSHSADTRDHKMFQSRELAPSAWPYTYTVAMSEQAPKSITVAGKESAFDTYLEEHATVTFLMIQHDMINYERRFKGYDPAHVHTSFSVAKSVMSILIACTIAHGPIRDVKQPVTDFVPELKKNGSDAVSLEHVLQMTSGLDFSESYVNPVHEVVIVRLARRPGGAPWVQFFRSMARSYVAWIDRS